MTLPFLVRDILNGKYITASLEGIPMLVAFGLMVAEGCYGRDVINPLTLCITFRQVLTLFFIKNGQKKDNPDQDVYLHVFA